MQAKDICLLASRTAKGGTGMVALAGQYLNLVLEDLKLNRDLKINRVTQTLVVQTGTNGPFNLEPDYLRTYDMFYPLQTPNGMTQFLTPITMEQYDAEFKDAQASNYPYEFATDLSTQAKAAASAATSQSVIGVTVDDPGYGYGTVPGISFGGPGSGAAALASLQCVAAYSGTFGAGYTPGDELTVVGGTFTRPAIIRKLTSGGQLTPPFEVLDPGEYTVIPGTLQGTGPNLYGQVAVTGGTGAGGLLNLVWGVGPITMVSGGTGYDTPPSANAVAGGPDVGATLTAVLTGGPAAGQVYIYPQSNGLLSITHRYMKNQPDIVNPETSTETPWFPFTQYLVRQTAALLMGITGDDRESEYLKENEDMLKPHLIMEGDEQATVRNVKLDPRHFHSSRGLKPTKTNPY